MEGYLSFKKGALRFRKVEMKNYWFVLKQDPTSAEFQYVLTWYKDETMTKFKGSINLLPSMSLLTEESKQFMLGYYFVVKSPNNEMYHFSGHSRNIIEKWVAEIREAIMTDVYAGTTLANKFMRERVVNIYISNSSISLIHPLAEETILSWRLSQIISFVFNETEFSFSICPKCNKCSGRFAQQVSLETGIYIVSSLEERLGNVYPGQKLFHEKTISGDIYRTLHSCQRIDKENIYLTGPSTQNSNRSSKLLSFPLSCISVGPSKPSKPRTPLNQPKYKRCPTPTCFTENSPTLSFTRHTSLPPIYQSRNHGCDTSSLYLKSALTSPVSVGSFRIDPFSVRSSHSQEDLLGGPGMQCLPKSPSLNTTKYIPGRLNKPSYSHPRLHSHYMSNPQPATVDWNNTLKTEYRSRHESLGDDLTDSPYARRSITPIPNSSRIMYQEETLNKLSIISELERPFKSGGPLGYDSHSLPIRRKKSLETRVRVSLRSNTFQFPIGTLPVKLAKEPNYTEGGKIIINNTEYQIPRMVPEDECDTSIVEAFDPSSDTSTSSPPDKNRLYWDRMKQRRYQSKRKSSTKSSTLSSTTLSDALPFSQEDSDSGPDRITLL
ncbi:hypothetical protein LOD99_2813 [Oopsacas minuta]|uniref:PH domain-containing protein n=1 Tax=Oopsacas minuta TaxID=111878 RepID=A0AAV7K2X9_9METZ|nr:hypothetical protein LOD99_2813 [Oopsacas minuta]